MTVVTEEGALAGFLLRHQGGFAASLERTRTHHIRSRTLHSQETLGHKTSLIQLDQFR